MKSITDFLRWYRIKDVVSTLEAMQKMVEFYHNKNIDTLKVGCTRPNLAKCCLHSSTSAKFYPFTESDKGLLSEVREHMVQGPPIVFTRKAVVDKTHIRKSTIVCISSATIDVSQLYSYSLCQPMHTGCYKRYEFDADLLRFKLHQNKCECFENMIKSCFRQLRLDCRIESFYTAGTLKKIDCFNADWFCGECNTVFEAMGCFNHFCPCQEARPTLNEEHIKREKKEKEIDEIRKQYTEEKLYTVIEMWECEWWKLYKTDV